jgi:hypothetical protein
MEQFEAWLSEQGISVAAQYATGSGDNVRYRLRLLDGLEVDVPLTLTMLTERPEQAIEAVKAAIDVRRGPGQTNGFHNN